MNPTPLLDFWQNKPDGAMEPVAVFATTFALDPEFFERNCLARFLEVTSVSEDSGSIDDIVASVELHELLQKTSVTVLADRSAPVERSSLMWDLLSCHVDGGLLHAKVAILIWENATRVIIGSANLTRAGYRTQIELGLAADLGPGCLLPPAVLTAIADELESYVSLVPGYDPDQAVFARAASTLGLFRERIDQQVPERSAMRIAFAPTNPTNGPLDQFNEVWKGPHPVWATHLSPFWDSTDPTALSRIREMLTGRPAEDRSQRVAVVLGPQGQTSFSQTLAETVDTVKELKPSGEVPGSALRLLHAKCLLMESHQWVAALVGSSNHTRAGLGIGARRHREMNVWLGAPQNSKEGKALTELVRLGRVVPPDAEEILPTDEDDADPELPVLPLCFGLCQVTRRSDDAPWELQLGISTDGMPRDWSVGITPDKPFLTRGQWIAQGSPAMTSIPIGQDAIPMYVVVCWEDHKAPWAVVADDPIALPPSSALASLRAHHLLDALAKGRSLGEIIRRELERAAASDEAHAGLYLDPLRRMEIEGSLLRKGRALATALQAMQRRLERQVVTLDTLRARLAGPLGPEFVAAKVVEAYQDEEQQQSRSEAVFTIAEIALSVGRVDWSHVLEHVDRERGSALVRDTLQHLNALRGRIDNVPSELASYARRASKEAMKCLPS